MPARDGLSFPRVGVIRDPEIEAVGNRLTDHAAAELRIVALCVVARRMQDHPYRLAGLAVEGHQERAHRVLAAGLQGHELRRYGRGLVRCDDLRSGLAEQADGLDRDAVDVRLYTAIVAGFVAALLGGSRTQVTGPTAAFVVILAPIYAKFGMAGLLLSGLLLSGLFGGLMLVLMGLLRLGRLIQFIPHPVTTRFTAGIATVIATLQLKDLFGITLAGNHDHAEVTEVHAAHPGTPDLPWPLPDGVVAYEISGPLFFGAAQKAMAAFGDMSDRAKTVILLIGEVHGMDATGLLELEHALERLNERRCYTILASVRSQPMKLLQKAHFADHDGVQICADSASASALQAAAAHIAARATDVTTVPASLSGHSAAQHALVHAMPMSRGTQPWRASTGWRAGKFSPPLKRNE